ncbi:transposase [Crateriforma conspicua]|uniref:Transposase IS200 like protein n=1 Tax=Crateriforma conspicua TaxID=2527996 RepID=A0A5C5XYX7_9PLAN|nr:transposase [Crateriforma conspicua]TWT68190.1 Transposase IS200 like protein [Crateriforma conspicua]
MLGECFDPNAPLSISEHYRPHWSQTGAIVFITFRTQDFIPQETLHRWERDKIDWIERSTGQPSPNWRSSVSNLTDDQRRRFLREFNRHREAYLDTCQGQCPFRDPALAQIVHDALLFFNGQRYRMGDFCVMPNHVHLLASFRSQQSLVEQCDSWLHYTAREVNRALSQKGKLWQQEPFDHLVRNPRQYEYLRNYIRMNGPKAKLAAGEYLYRRHSE